MTGCGKLCGVYALVGAMVLVLAGFSAMAPSAKALEPTHGGIVYEGHEYLYMSSTKSYEMAKASAENQGGHLVTVTSSGENTFVNGLIYGGDVWLGMTDAGTEGTYEWTTGESVSFTNWASGQPWDPNGYDDNARMFQSGQWDVVSAGYSLGSVIEWEPAEEDEAANPILDLCGLGFVGIAPLTAMAIMAARTKRGE